MEASFLQASRALEILFPPVDLVVTVSPLAFRGYGGLYLCCFLFSFFLFQTVKQKSRCLVWKVAVVRVFQRWFWPDFSIFSCRYLEPDLRNPIAFLKTRAPQPSSQSSSAPAASSTVHAGRQSPTSGLHAPESYLLFGARDGHAPPFSGLLLGFCVFCLFVLYILLFILYSLLVYC